MLNVDEQITRLHRLYRQLTGEDPPRSDVPMSPLPTNSDPTEFVQNQLRQLDWILNKLGNPGGVRAAPAVTLYERDNIWTCEVELPGVRKEDVTLSIEEGELRLSARRDLSGSARNAQLLYSDASIGTLERRIALPKHIDETSFEARVENGVLFVSCKKNPSRAGRDFRIEVG